MTDNIPANAIKIQFSYGDRNGVFHVWPKKGGRYYWSALGNNGEAPTMDKAIDLARCWIINDSIPNSGEEIPSYDLVLEQQGEQLEND